MGALLVVAVVIPALAGLVTWKLPSPPLARTVVQWACVGAAACWVLAAALDDVAAGPLGTRGLAAPAAAGVALAGAAVRRPLRRFPAALIGVAVTAATLGLAIAGGEGAPVDAASGLVGAALALAVATRSEADGGMRHAAAGLAGAALVGIGIAGLDGADLPTRGTLPGGTTVPVLLGAAIVVVAAGERPRRALAPLLPVVLAIGLPLGPLVADGRGPIAIAMAVLAAAAALWPGRRPAVSIALLALAAAVLPGGAAAARLLAAGAVVAHVGAIPAAVAAALPGAAALAMAVADDTDRVHLAVGLLAVLVAFGATRWAVVDQEHAVGDDGARPGAWAALALGAWLLAAPHTWTWAGDAAPPAWGSGAIVALTGVVAALAVLTDLGNRPIPAGRIDAPEPYAGEPDGRIDLVATGAALALAVVASLALVLSVAS